MKKLQNKSRQEAVGNLTTNTHPTTKLMYISDTVDINVPPEAVYDWMMTFVENYQSWHPAHVTSRWLKGEPYEVGSVLYVEEYLGDELHKLKFKITKIMKNKGFEFRILFPESIIMPKGEFLVEPTATGSQFTATLYYRFGKLLNLFAKKEKEIIEQHQREEGINLKRLLEGKDEA